MEQFDLVDFSQFLEKRDLVPGKYVRYYVGWVRRFLQTPETNRTSLSKADCLRVKRWRNCSGMPLVNNC
mgnify:CR=1 FL=1